ncbi:hypothetical protein [Hymenobacter lapidarius]|nr:hypothetical protein [Hymenobacter lapidarius]
MIIGSLKSDILPVVRLGFPTMHVPAEPLAGLEFRVVARREVLELVE